MADITAGLVKELRKNTGAGMMDCKRALKESNGDLEVAVDWLRTQGLAAAAKKSGRAASEGLVGIAMEAGKGAVIEINSETDFVARNEEFQGFVKNVSSIALAGDGKIDSLMDTTYLNTGINVAETLTKMISTIGENLDLRRSAILQVDKGIVSGYMHNALQPGLGKIGVLIALESEGDSGKLEILGKQLAMHVAAANPQALSRNDVDVDDLQREKTILTEQAQESGKPNEIIEKMVEGRLRKYFEEICLLEQTYVIDGESKVSKAVELTEKEIGSSVLIKGFVRFALGEGIEKTEGDFAAEVAAAAAS